MQVSEALHPLQTPHSLTAEHFVLAMRAPALEMMLHGTRIDQSTRVNKQLQLELDLSKYREILQEFSFALWDRELNPNSSAQLQALFFDYLGIEPIRVNKKGEQKISLGRDVLEKLRESHHWLKPLINTILGARDCIKMLGVLRTGIDSDNRFRASYNICGTETARWSSSGNAFGTGANQQNITEKLRQMFCADPGYKLGYADLEQAESRAVAYLAEDLRYIHACESGDLHTTVTSMVWKDLGWTGTLATDKAKAEEPFYRSYSYRDMAKRGGHGTNYYGKPYTMAKHLKVKTDVMERFQADYFAAFPGIPAWHKSVRAKLTTQGYLDTPLGRRRYFFSRLYEDVTLRAAIAFGPQNLVGELLNLSLYRVWQQGHSLGIQCLMQIHDAIVFQYPEERELECLALVRELMIARAMVNGREMVIPSETQVGWNWAKFHETKNPDGLKKLKTGVQDVRKRTKSPEEGLLDRVLCGNIQGRSRA